ncbi:MAG TPA: hypothetical protein PLH79_07750 [bacterium]|nr:hypothetical protein [bacterium]
MRWLEWFDAVHFLNIRIWDFSFRSLRREYGRDFIKSVLLRHPVRTWRGIQYYQHSEIDAPADENSPGEGLPVFHQATDGNADDRGRGKPVLGVGFCLKSLNPPCVSGRSNHDCYFLEQNLHRRPDPHRASREIPASCQACVIKEIGLLSLSAGYVFYIMTSARDILHDLILPSLKTNQFTQGLFVICRYSFEPFRMALAIAGIRARLFSYDQNDCRDYASWLRADNGNKEEQTSIIAGDWDSTQQMLSNPDTSVTSPTSIEKRGNLFFPL